MAIPVQSSRLSLLPRVTNPPFRWVSLITVMAGVALVGLSGSLIKSTLTESPLGNILPLRARGSNALESVDEPEATTVLVGELPCAFILSPYVDSPISF
jgi:hypothetical protein